VKLVEILRGGQIQRKNIKYYFINFYLTIFVNDKVLCIIIIKCKSVKTKEFIYRMIILFIFRISTNFLTNTIYLKIYIIKIIKCKNTQSY
jgi:hypothetical protein